MTSDTTNQMINTPVIESLEDQKLSNLLATSNEPQIIAEDYTKKMIQIDIQLHKRELKKRKRAVKQKVVTTAKAILFSELLGSCLVILYMFLFYAKIYKTKQENVIAYIILYVFSDILFLSSWIISFAALVLRNDRCINYCKYSLSLNIITKIIALIVYQMAIDSYKEIVKSSLIIGLTIGMIIYSIIYFALYTYMKNKWSFIAPDRWQRKFNPNLRFEDIKKTNQIQMTNNTTDSNSQNTPDN